MAAELTRCGKIVEKVVENLLRRAEMKFKWVVLENLEHRSTLAAEVPGGVIVRTAGWYAGAICESTVFVPDCHIQENDGEYEIEEGS